MPGGLFIQYILFFSSLKIFLILFFPFFMSSATAGRIGDVTCGGAVYNRVLCDLAITLLIRPFRCNGRIYWRRTVVVRLKLLYGARNERVNEK